MFDWERVSCFSADQSKCNFEVKHSLYTNIITVNDDDLKINCNARILHNSVKSDMKNLEPKCRKYYLENIDKKT